MEPIDANVTLITSLFTKSVLNRRFYSYKVFYKVAILFALLYPLHECLA